MNIKFKLLITGLFLLSMNVAAQFTTANPSNVVQAYESTWNKASYPRLFGSTQEITNIKNLYNSGDALVKKSIERMLGEANTALTKAIPGWGLDAANLRVSSVHTISKEFVPQLSIAYLITGDEKYARRLWDVALALMNYQDWGVATTAPYRDRHFLDTGIGAFNAAMIYDALSGWMTTEQKDSLYAMTRKFVLVPVLAQYNGTASRSWNWMGANNNWNGICNGGVISACLTMFEHDKSFLSDVASRAINFLPNYINAFEPDGQSEEGLMYWSYGLMYTVTAFDIMQRTLGSTYGYSGTNGLRKTGYFPVYTAGPVATINVGDDGVRSNRTNSIMWFSKHLQDPNLAKLSYDLFMENGGWMPWFDLFHYNPTLVQQGTELTPGPDNYIRGIDLYSFVERWKDRNALYLAVHAGNNRANHGHLDAGSFYIQGLGEYWAFGNLGSDSYTNAGYFDFGDKANNDCTPTYNGSNYAPSASQSWHFYRKRAEGKNAVVFNPDYRADQDPSQEAVYKGFMNSSEKIGSGTINLNMIYNRDVNSYARGYSLDRERRVITINDNISAKSNKNIWWNMHTRANISLSADKRTALLTQNGKSMKVVLRSPVNGQFQVASATYLEGRTFPLTVNSSNSNYKKLAINLKDTRDVTIRVEFFPAEEGDKEEMIDQMEGFSYNYTAVGSVRIEASVANPQKDSINGSDLVMKVTRLSGSAEDAGVQLSSKEIRVGVGAGQYRYFKVKLYRQDSAPVRLRLKNGAESVDFNSTSNLPAGKWQEYTFDLMRDSEQNSMEGRVFDGFVVVPGVNAPDNTISYIDDIRLSNVIDNAAENIWFASQKPAQLQYSHRTASSLRLSWKPVAGTINYQVYDNKQLVQTVTDTLLILTGIAPASVHHFTVTALNANGQPSLSSDEVVLKTRGLDSYGELVDDFETALVPWQGSASGASVLVDQANPVKSAVNNSAKCMKLSRLAFSSNEVGVKLENSDLFNLNELPRFLHVKLYRGTIARGVQVELSGNQTGIPLRRLQPVNASDTLLTTRWVDFVFDLAGSDADRSFTTLTIIPDRTPSHNSTRSYFIDDVVFSNAATAYTSVAGIADETAFRLKNIASQYVLEAQQPLVVSLYDTSGRNLMPETTVESGMTISTPMDLAPGIYLLGIRYEGNQSVQKLVIR